MQGEAVTDYPSLYSASCSARRPVLGQSQIFVLAMAAGSLVGSFIGGKPLGLVPPQVLLPLPAAILLISAVKVWWH
jgi:uncharacterized membrane protein YfcA